MAAGIPHIRMKMSGWASSILVIILLIGWGAAIVSATDAPPVSASPMPQQQRLDNSLDQEIRQTIDALVVQALNLPEERAESLLNTLREARLIRQTYQRRRETLEQQLEVLVRDDSSQTEIRQLLQDIENAKTRYYQDSLHIDQTLWALLSSEEHAEYILVQRRLTRQLHDLILTIRKEREASPSQQRSDFLLRQHEEESVIRKPR